MADRNLVTYLESRNPEGPYWRLKIDRSAGGQPGLMFTISTEMFDPHYARLNEELTIFVEDGNEVLAPVIAWLEAGNG